MVSTEVLIYAGHFFSSWGDRMWHFAIPLFLMKLDPTSLALSAGYGLTLACSVLLFGPLVGDWIDRSPRLHAARVSLVLQNLAVILCALVLLLNLRYGDNCSPCLIAVEIGAIVLGAVSQVASVATGIIIQKDWVVVVAGGKKDKLANLNSMVRRIDLSTKILSPLACGQIMAVAGLMGGAIFITCWNAFSMCIEYILLKKVYDRTPALAHKNNTEENPEGEEMVELHEGTGNGNEENEENDKDKEDKSGDKKQQSKQKESIFRKMFSFLFTLKDGWKLYIAQPIAMPCFGFSFLYMTVLGFGYITTSYAYNQCFSELLVGILLAAAAVTGIIATFLYPVMRKKLGLIRTGLFNAVFQILTLSMCIASVFVSGSPFFLLPVNQVSPTPSPTTNQSTTNISSNVVVTNSSNLFIKCLDGVSIPPSFLSLSLLMSGIVLARIGLWGFDLTITQLIQETVKESDRGVVNGVQTSLNNFMDMIRYILVLALPLPSQFGILVMLSSISVCFGYILYCIYAHRIRGHLLPRCKGSSTKAPNDDNVAT